MTRALNELSQSKIKGYESLRLVPYDDARPNYVLKPGDPILGTLTAGWGHAGPDVEAGKAITEAQAQAWFDADTADACKCVETEVKVPLTDNQFGALVSFTYNVGCNSFRTSSLLKRLNTGDYDAVLQELPHWNKQHVNGKVVVDNGLTIRRASEAGLWATGSAARGANITPVAPPPFWRAALQTAHVRLKSVGAALGGLGVGGAELQDAGHKVADAASLWHALAGVGLVMILAGIVFELFRPNPN